MRFQITKTKNINKKILITSNNPVVVNKLADGKINLPSPYNIRPRVVKKFGRKFRMSAHRAHDVALRQAGKRGNYAVDAGKLGGFPIMRLPVVEPAQGQFLVLLLVRLEKLQDLEVFVWGISPE